MISVSIDHLQQQGQIVLTQDIAMSWKQNCWLIALLAMVTFSVAIYLSLQGAWLILPFAGLEVAALYALFYYWHKKNNKMEVLRFTPETCVIERGQHTPQYTDTFERFWLKVELPHQADEWYMTRVILHHRQQSLEVGAFLNEEDKTLLVKHIKQLVPVQRH